jgi:L-ascorbate metabolism protein UlaG (beta-lactamase superfamily)
MFAQGAYYITSNGEAAIIDPLWNPTLSRAIKRDSVQLKYIFETHFHADSGHVDLSREPVRLLFLVQMLFANLTVLLQQTGRNSIGTSK